VDETKLREKWSKMGHHRTQPFFSDAGYGSCRFAKEKHVRALSYIRYREWREVPSFEIDTCIRSHSECQLATHGAGSVEIDSQNGAVQKMPDRPGLSGMQLSRRVL